MKEKTAKVSAADYRAAVEAASYFVQGQIGVLRLSGPDRLDFLQRQTTNDLIQLGPARALTTVLTNPSARILDVLLLVEDEESILVLTLPGHGEQTADHLRRMIFFMDKVEVHDETPDWTVIDLEGPKAGELLAMAGGQSPAFEEMQWRNIGGVKLRTWAQRGLTASMGYRLLAKKGDAEPIVSALENAGASPVSDDSREILRVEAGMPGAHELTDAYTPLETNMDWAISDTKGCYTGQEVIARQLTYDKVTQRLVRLHLESQVSPGAQVYAEAKKIGQVTSSALSPRHGPLALAVVKRPHHTDGTKIIVENEGLEIKGRVSAIHV